MTGSELREYQRQRRERYIAGNGSVTSAGKADDSVVGFSVTTDTTVTKQATECLSADNEKRRKNREAQRQHREKDPERHAAYMRAYKEAHKSELAEKRKQYKAKKRAEAIASGAVTPKATKLEKKPKVKKPQLTDEERKKEKRQYERQYRQRKRAERDAKILAAAVSEPVPDDRKLAVVLGENVRRKLDSPHIVVMVYPLCNRYVVCTGRNGQVVDTKYYDSENAAFASVKKHRLQRYRDISAEALADYYHRTEVKQ